MSAAVNRGKVPNTPQDAEDGRGKVVKPLRRRGTELQAAIDPAIENNGVPKQTRGRPVTVQLEEDELASDPAEIESSPKKKRGRPAGAREHDESIREPAEYPIVPKKRGRYAIEIAAQGSSGTTMNDPASGKKKRGQPSISRPEEQHEVPVELPNHSKPSKLVRRGRSSNTPDELQTTAAWPQPEGKKRGQRSKTESEEHAAVELSMTDKDIKLAKPLRRGRSSNTEAEVQAAVESSTKEQISQKKRGRLANTDGEVGTGQISSSGDRMGRKKGTRGPNATIAGQAALLPSDQVRSKRPTQHSDAEVEEPAAAESFIKDVPGRKIRGRQSNVIIDVQTATSALSRDRILRKKRDNASNIKVVPGSSASRENSKSKIRLPSDADIPVSTASQGLGKKSKRPSYTETKRKRKEIDGKISIYDYQWRFFSPTP